jgi:hypothetical protein
MADRELLPDLKFMIRTDHNQTRLGIHNFAYRGGGITTYLTEATSDLSATASPFDKPDVDPLGLSVFPPDTFERMAPRNDLFDSLVSALLNDGYEAKLSIPLSSDVCEALLLGVVASEPFEF